MEVLVSCNCGDTPVFARQAYMDLTGHSAPRVYSGAVGISKLIDTLPKPSMAKDYLRDYIYVKRPFAFWFTIDDNGDIKKGVDLFTGHEIK